MTNVTKLDTHYLSEERLRKGLELLFFAYRDFLSDSDAILEKYGFGRAHHRVIYFVGRHPGINVSELLAILQITKQSLSRVLSQLIEQGFIVQKPGSVDRRQRLLELSDQGLELEKRLWKLKGERLQKSYTAGGAENVCGFEIVLRAMINEKIPETVKALLDGQPLNQMAAS